jgi:peptidyl-tRNA hydrolase, PTH1 family
MKIIVGLGNPGGRYSTTPHNAGFIALDLLAQKWSGQFSSSRFRGDLAKVSIPAIGPCLLFKPMTFMNRSGEPLAALMQFHKIADSELCVIHDDIDQEFGRVKMRQGGGHGGHNGIRNIIPSIGSSDFARIKLGVGRPSPEDPMSVSDYVLRQLSDGELDGLSDTILAELMPRLDSWLKPR